MKNLGDKFNSGHVLMTVATGDLSGEQSERCGLVQNHAYALLDIRFVQVGLDFDLLNKNCTTPTNRLIFRKGQSAFASQKPVEKSAMERQFQRVGHQELDACAD